MQRINLSAAKRTLRGKGPARRLRAEGRVPAVFYGKKTDNISLSVDAREFRKILEKAGMNALFDLEIADNGSTETRTALLKERQVRPVDGALIHLDFIEVFMDETIEVSVHVEFEGKAIGMEKGGILQPLVRDVLVSCLPADVPSTIKVDVSNLDMGSSIHIGEMEPPEGVTFKQDAGIAVVTVVAPKRVEEEVVEEEEEMEEGAEAPEGEEKAEKGEKGEKAEPSAE